MADEFASRAAQRALSDLEENLITASRAYEDAARSGDEISASWALKSYASAKREYDELAGTGQQQQQQPAQLSAAQKNFLSKRSAGGDQLTPQRMADYARGHDKAVAAGLQVDLPQYFRAVAHYCDHLGDGRIAPLDEREAAKISGVDEQTYAAHAARLRALKRAGHYRDD